MSASPPAGEVPQVDLTNCDREPIHIPGSVQPHGVLLALEETTLRVVRASANTDEFLGVETGELLGETVALVLDEHSVQLVRSALASPHPQETSPLRLRRRTPAPHPVQDLFDGILHRSGDLAILELEPAALSGGMSFTEFYRRVYQASAPLGVDTDVLTLCGRVVQEVRGLTGFDRVMAYRFDDEGHGHVIAEAKRVDLETFLGLHYPAADIPAQARRLYVLNTLRFIVDVAYRPVPIEPASGPMARDPLDLSFSVLRSVSPIHVEYLRNMGVHASMSVSLLRDGQLWGMIICHHYAPRFVPYETRKSCEFLGRVLSWQVAVRERAEELSHVARAQTGLAELVEHLSSASDFVAGLSSHAEGLLSLVEAQGAAIVHEGNVTLFGRTPQRSEVEALAQWLSRRGEELFATTRLPPVWEGVAGLEAVASGVLAVALSSPMSDFVLWFRPEVVRTVDWAGDPAKTLTVSDGVPRLSPRGSFALWKETVRGTSMPWQPWTLNAASGLQKAVMSGALRRATELGRLNSELRSTTEELRAASHAKDDFLAMVSHELRTPLNAMLGWLRILRAGPVSNDQRERALETVERNARHQAQLVDDLLDVSRIIAGKLRLEVSPVDLASTVQAAVDTVRPAADAKGLRLEVALDPAAGPVLGDAVRLQQVTWNLLTNAIKFTPKGGRVRVYLTRTASYADLCVADTGEGIDPAALPHVFERFRQAEGGSARRFQGLGLGLSIVRHLIELHGGTVGARSDGKGKGAQFCVRLPLAPLRAAVPDPPQGHPPDAAHRVSIPPTSLAGLRILVVDDERDATELLAAILTPCGAQVYTANAAKDALEILQRERPDMLVSDVGMPVMDGYTLIRHIRALPASQGAATPAVALTAYARTEDRSRAFLAGFDAHIPKPVEASELLAVLAGLAARRSIERTPTTPMAAAFVAQPPPSEPSAQRAEPAAPASTPRMPTPTSVPAVRPLEGVRVLAVDDDADQRVLLTTVLEFEGALVRTEGSADDALAVIEHFRPDVIVSDLGMPDRDGLAFIREVRALGEERGGWVSAVALTGRASPEEGRRALLAGYQLHIVKPFDTNELVAKVARLAGRKRNGTL